MKIGINLLWLRHGKVGGIESYICNLIEGFSNYDYENEYVLYLARDNEEHFRNIDNSRFRIRSLKVNSANVYKRIIWENIFLSKEISKDNLDILFFPMYCKPLYISKKVPCITTIHDIQAMHYSEYFSKFHNLFMRIEWYFACKTSARIIATSNFCKSDIAKHFKVKDERITVIPIPIVAKPDKTTFDIIRDKYRIKPKKYFYTVSYFLPHKNLFTLIKAMHVLKMSGKNERLVISGTKGEIPATVTEYIQANNLNEIIIFTDYIAREERDALYSNCKMFLFPSIFEGFGMPPIESLMLGVPTVTTKEASILEVTQGKALYVNNPKSESEWADFMSIDGLKQEECYFPEYDLGNISKQFRELFYEIKSSK